MRSFVEFQVTRLTEELPECTNKTRQIMAKRKQGTDSDSEDSDVNFVDVQFDFFDPNPSVDYHALKRLLMQLFQSDAELFHPQELVELILSQPTVGTTIKTEGIDSDPYAILTVLNIHVHQNHPSIKALSEYALHKASPDPAFHSTLQSLFRPPAENTQNNHVGLVICERLVNMPVQVIPPMYRMLSDELKSATDDNEPYSFTHLLFISRTYRLSAAEEAAMQAQSSKTPLSKRTRRQAFSNPPAPPADGIYSFHPEDDCILQFASHSISYSFNKSSEPRSEDSFGLDTGGRLMLVPFNKFNELIARMSNVYAVD